MMKAFLSPFALFLLLQSMSCADASLEEICKTIKEKTTDNEDYNFCLTSLQVVPESQKADNQALAIIATKLAKANFTHNLAKIKTLQNSIGVSEGAKGALADCSKVYTDGTNQLQDAIEKFENSSITLAFNYLTAAATKVVMCIGAWEVRDENSLLLKENDNAHKLLQLALEITTFFLQ